MRKNTFSACLICVCFITHKLLVSGANQSYSDKFFNYKNARGNGAVLRTTVVEYATQCARMCVREDGCNLYNLRPDANSTRPGIECELVTRDMQALDDSATDGDGRVMYLSEGWQCSFQVRT